MKRTLYLGILAAAAVALQSCSTSKSALNTINDDVYYTQADDKNYKPETTEESTGTESSPEERSDYGSRQNPGSASEYERDRKTNTGEGGDTYINNNYYYDDNSYGYNDFYYSSRIRRFYHPGATFGYFNPYYSYGYNYRPGWNINISYGYPYYGWNDPFWSPYSCYDPFWGPTWSGFYHDPYFYPYSYSPYYSPYGAYNKGYYDGYYSNWNNWGGGSNWGGSGSGGGSINTYYGPRTTQGSHNILNSGMRNAPPRIRKESQPVNTGDKPQEMPDEQPRGVVRDQQPVLQPGNEAGEKPENNSVPVNREAVDDNQNPNSEWKTRYNTPLDERPKFSTPDNTNDNYSHPQQEQPQMREEPRQETQPRFEQRNEQPRYESKPQPRNEQPRYEQPRNEQPRYEQPKYERPAPQNNNYNAPRNSGGNNSPGNNNNGGSKPRFQGR